MKADALYRLTGPSVWAGAPTAYSFSTLRTLRECALRWQLQRSTYGDQRGFPERPNAAALTGKVLHQALDLLFQALGARGMPAVGSASFQDTLRALDLIGKIRAGLQRQQAMLAENPRARGLRLLVTERELYNQVCRLFHPLYAQARAARRGGHERGDAPEAFSDELQQRLRTRGVLTELRLTHPTLPILGVIDLLWQDGAGTRIVDFKTGVPQPHHREQVALYALLWWRASGELPSALEIRYPEVTETVAVTAGELVTLEEQVRAEFQALAAVLASPPAEARPGPHCARCDVRGLCDAYWARRPVSDSTVEEGTWCDAEGVVLEVAADGTVRCRAPGGGEFAVLLGGQMETGGTAQGGGIRELPAALFVAAGQSGHREELPGRTGQRPLVEVDDELVLGEAASVAGPRHASDELHDQAQLVASRRRMVGERPIGVVPNHRVGEESESVQRLAQLRHVLPVVLVGAKHLEQQDEPQQRGHHLGLVAGNEHRGALAPVAHLWVGDADRPVSSGLLTDSQDLPVGSKLDVMGHDRGQRKAGLHKRLLGRG